MGPKAQAMTDQTIIRPIWVFYWYHNFFFYWKQTAASVLPISFFEFIWYIYCFYWAGFSWYFQLKRSFWMYAKRFYTQILFWVDLVMFQFLNSPGLATCFYSSCFDSILYSQNACCIQVQLGHSAVETPKQQ